MKTIVIATDFSNVANDAMFYALETARVLKRRVLIFHLYKVSVHTANSRIGTKGIDEMLEKKRTEVAALAEKLSAEYQLEVLSEVRMGDYLDTIESLMQTYNGSLLVVGMPQRSLEQNLMGNATTAAIHRFKFPILAVPIGVKFTGVKQILYACDLNRGIHAHILQNVKEYASAYNAHVQAFFVGKEVEKIKTNLGELNAAFEGINYLYKNVPSESVIAAIEKEAKAINADLIVMTPHRYGFWSSILHTSKTRAMASNGKVPLLSLAY